MPHRVIDISFKTFLRASGAVALGWIWLHLWQWALVFVLAIFVAIALEPAVRWAGARGVRRAYAAPLLGLFIALLIGGFFALAGASLASEARLLGSHMGDVSDGIVARLPTEVQQASSSLMPSAEALTRAGRAFAGGLGGVALALVLTVYLLLDGRCTYLWLVAFAPAAHRGRVHQSAARARVVIAAYVRGNVITSVLTTVFTWIALASLQVPAALVLAVLAGILDFVPVVGFIVSAIPAVLLGLTVSPAVGLGVALFYIAYNIVENYYIQPKVASCSCQIWRSSARFSSAPSSAEYSAR